MTAEEFFNKNIKDLDGKETKNSIVFFYKDSIVNAIKEFAQLKCAEQRHICADNIVKEAELNFGSTVSDCWNLDSIIDAKEPEI